MDSEMWLTYCGLYCELCGERARIPKQAQALRQSLRAEGYDQWGRGLEGFEAFWSFLEGICDPDGACPGCKEGGGPPSCAIRNCARARGLEVCVRCEAYPCGRIEELARGYPTLLADGERMRELGIAAWVAEQERRAQSGFAYVDIRCEPYEVPSE
jgi:hypothetical protein